MAIFTMRGPAAGLAGAMLLVLGGCMSGGGGGPSGLFNPTAATEKTDAKKLDIRPEDFIKRFCPPLRIRSGTEAMIVYERGHDTEPDFARYQASIKRTARECGPAADTMTIKVGLMGSVVGGPKGGAGTVTLPVRIAVVKQSGGEKPLFTQLYKVPSSLAAPEFRGDFSFVQTVTFKLGPEDRDLIVYVGFDEGKKS